MALNPITVRPSGYVREPQGPAVETQRHSAEAITGRQFIRRLYFTLGGMRIDCSELNARFTVKDTQNSVPCWCNIRATNLSKPTRDELMAICKASKGSQGAQFELYGGYPGREGLLFSGEVQQARSGKEVNGTDTYFDILATSLMRAYGFSTVSKTLDKGWKYDDAVKVVTDAFKAEGLKIGHLDKLPTKAFPRALTMWGQARDEMSRIAEATGKVWTMGARSTLELVDPGGYVPGRTIVIDGTTGMIGIPEQTIEGIVVKILLNPGVQINQQIHLNTTNINEMAQTPLLPGSGGLNSPQSSLGTKLRDDGLYNVVRVDHEGDVRGQDFYTIITCVDHENLAVGQGRIDQGRESGEIIRGIPEKDEWAESSPGAGAGGRT
jgi:hypothetical protein